MNIVLPGLAEASARHCSVIDYYNLRKRSYLSRIHRLSSHPAHTAQAGSKTRRSNQLDPPVVRLLEQAGGVVFTNRGSTTCELGW